MQSPCHAIAFLLDGGHISEAQLEEITLEKAEETIDQLVLRDEFEKWKQDVTFTSGTATIEGGIMLGGIMILFGTVEFDHDEDETEE